LPPYGAGAEFRVTPSIDGFGRAKADWLTASINLRKRGKCQYAKLQRQGHRAFESYLESTRMTMATSNERHINISPSGLESPRIKQDRLGEKVHSGNTVSLENELLKLGETNSQFALDTGLIKSFNRMIMASLKG
jgi:flagellar basal body rod protein FlgB